MASDLLLQSLRVLESLVAEPIPRLRRDVDDKHIQAAASVSAPFIISDSHVMDVCKKWTLEYLECEAEGNFDVRYSESDFMYHNEKSKAEWPGVQTHVDMKPKQFTDFVQEFNQVCKARGTKPFAEPKVPIPAGTERASLFSLLYSTAAQRAQMRDVVKQAVARLSAERQAAGQAPLDLSCPPRQRLMYLQQQMFDGIGSAITSDFMRIDWPWLAGVQKAGHWQSITSNLLLIGHVGTVTPAHFDEQENMYTQLRGRKLVVLAPPRCWAALSPYPVGHPLDRQAQADLRFPDLSRFPRVADVPFTYAILNPGDTLYIPACWFHHFESPWEDTMSLNAWWKTQDPDPKSSQAKLKGMNFGAGMDKGGPGSGEDEAMNKLALKSWLSVGPQSSPALAGCSPWVRGQGDPVGHEAVSLRRNVEKMLKASAGLQGARPLWGKIASAVLSGAGEGGLAFALTPQEQATVQQVRDLLNIVLSPGAIWPFLAELTAERFGLLGQ